MFHPDNQVLTPNCDQSWQTAKADDLRCGLRKWSVPAGWRSSLWRKIKPAACRFLCIDPCQFHAHLYVSMGLTKSGCEWGCGEDESEMKLTWSCHPPQTSEVPLCSELTADTSGHVAKSPNNLQKRRLEKRSTYVMFRLFAVNQFD